MSQTLDPGGAASTRGVAQGAPGPAPAPRIGLTRIETGLGAADVTPPASPPDAPSLNESFADGQVNSGAESAVPIRGVSAAFSSGHTPMAQGRLRTAA
jgi:hypothetical protein